MTSSEQELVSLTKKECKQYAIDQVKKMVDAGDVDIHRVASEVIRMKEIVASYESELRKALLDAHKEDFTAHGVLFSTMNTGDRLNYDENPEYKRLNKQLKELKEQITFVSKKNVQGVVDHDGVIIEPVSVKTHGSTVMKMSF